MESFEDMCFENVFAKYGCPSKTQQSINMNYQKTMMHWVGVGKMLYQVFCILMWRILMAQKRLTKGGMQKSCLEIFHPSSIDTSSILSAFNQNKFEILWTWSDSSLGNITLPLLICPLAPQRFVNTPMQNTYPKKNTNSQ